MSLLSLSATGSIKASKASSVTQTTGDSTTVVFRLFTPWMHALLTLSIPERESTSMYVSVLKRSHPSEHMVVEAGHNVYGKASCSPLALLTH